jgi:hypothetical protein
VNALPQKWLTGTGRCRDQSAKYPAGDSGDIYDSFFTESQCQQGVNSLTNGDFSMAEFLMMRHFAAHIQAFYFNKKHVI